MARVTAVDFDDIDPGSDAAAAIMIDEAVAHLGLRYVGIDASGSLLLQTTSHVSEDMSDDELTKSVSKALEATDSQNRFGIRSFIVITKS